MARKRRRGTDEAAALEGGLEPEQPGAAPEPVRLTPVDVQQKVFRLAFRGYNERDVDEFLDEVTESLAALHEENKRLREQLQDSGVSGATVAAQRQAEAIIRQAREQAAGISEGTGVAGTGADAPPASFLVRERAFLQRIAALVQDHARSLKEDARRLREGSGAAAAAGAAGGAVAGAAAVTEADTTDTEPGTEDHAEPEEEPGVEPEVGLEPAEAEAAATDASQEAEADVDRPEEEAGSAATAVGAGGLAAGSPAPEEATAPWRSPEQEEADWAGSSTDDPLVSAWESAFASESGQAPEEPSEESSAAPGEGRDKEEPSLRELFWGEE
jgi:DivIVA domain-containing protein